MAIQRMMIRNKLGMYVWATLDTDDPNYEERMKKVLAESTDDSFEGPSEEDKQKFKEAMLEYIRSREEAEQRDRESSSEQNATEQTPEEGPRYTVKRRETPLPPRPQDQEVRYCVRKKNGTTMWVTAKMREELRKQGKLE